MPEPQETVTHPVASTPPDSTSLRRRALVSPTALFRSARARQHARYGGINWGAAFFGWLVATGLAALLVALVGAIGAAIGYTELGPNGTLDNAGTIGVVSGVALLIILIIAYYAGGYVAGRMSRFDGGRQGFGTWFFGILVTILLAAAAVTLGSKFNLLHQLNLPHIPVREGNIATAGIVALVSVVFATLFSSISGGRVGERYHKKIDQIALDEASAAGSSVAFASPAAPTTPASDESALNS